MMTETKYYHQILSNREIQDPVQVSIVETFSSTYIDSALMHGKLIDERPITLKFSRMVGNAEKEWQGLNIVYAHGVSVPEPIALVIRGEEPRTGIIMERIFGPTLNTLDSQEARYNLGRELKKMNSIAVPGYGLITNGIPRFTSMEEYTEDLLERTLPYVRKGSQAGDLLVQWYAKAKLHRLAQEPRFLHRDVKDTNILVKGDASTVFVDFEWWTGGDPLDDPAVYLYHAIRLNKPPTEYASFLNGYFEEQTLSDAQRYDLLFLILLTALRIVSFCARLNPSHLEEAYEDVEKVVTYLKVKSNIDYLWN